MLRNVARAFSPSTCIVRSLPLDSKYRNAAAVVVSRFTKHSGSQPGAVRWWQQDEAERRSMGTKTRSRLLKDRRTLGCRLTTAFRFYNNAQAKSVVPCGWGCLLAYSRFIIIPYFVTTRGEIGGSEVQWFFLVANCECFIASFALFYYCTTLDRVCCAQSVDLIWCSLLLFIYRHGRGHLS